MPQRSSTSSTQSIGLIREIIRQFRLGWRLFQDPRVSSWLKLIVPGLLLVYVVMPLDLIPDVIPVLGQMDDLAVILLAGKIFIELCPSQIVREYLEAMDGSRRTVEPGSDEGDESPPEGPVIEGKYRVLDDEPRQ